MHAQRCYARDQRYDFFAERSDTAEERSDTPTFFIYTCEFYVI